MLIEPCPSCGFDRNLYDSSDTITSLAVVPAVLRAAVEGLTAEQMQAKGEAAPSIAECLAALAPEAEYDLLESDLRDAAASVTETEARAHDLLHEGFHALATIGRIRQANGTGAAPATAIVAALHSSTGGVPKLPIEEARITPSGVEGDSQADRRHHGRPCQAICLWSTDVIAELNREGHPIQAGQAGENITISGAAWAELRPGSRIDVGGVPMLISAHAIPCAKNAAWFRDRDFKRILHDRHPGSSRLYAIPLGSGIVKVGGPVTIEPAKAQM